MDPAAKIDPRFARAVSDLVLIESRRPNAKKSLRLAARDVRELYEPMVKEWNRAVFARCAAIRDGVEATMRQIYGGNLPPQTTSKAERELDFTEWTLSRHRPNTVSALINEVSDFIRFVRRNAALVQVALDEKE